MFRSHFWKIGLAALCSISCFCPRPQARIFDLQGPHTGVLGAIVRLDPSGACSWVPPEGGTWSYYLRSEITYVNRSANVLRLVLGEERFVASTFPARADIADVKKRRSWGAGGDTAEGLFPRELLNFETPAYLQTIDLRPGQRFTTVTLAGPRVASAQGYGLYPGDYDLVFSLAVHVVPPGSTGTVAVRGVAWDLGKTDVVRISIPRRNDLPACIEP